MGKTSSLFHCIQPSALSTHCSCKIWAICIQPAILWKYTIQEKGLTHTNHDAKSQTKNMKNK